MKNLLVVLALTFSALSHAVGRGGNGGDVIICLKDIVTVPAIIKKSENSKPIKVNVRFRTEIDGTEFYTYIDHETRFECIDYNCDKIESIRFDDKNTFLVRDFNSNSFQIDNFEVHLVREGKVITSTDSKFSSNVFLIPHIVESIITRESYKLKNWHPNAQIYNHLKNSSFQNTLDYFGNFLEKINNPTFPSFYEQAISPTRGIGLISEGYPIHALKDVNDQGIEIIKEKDQKRCFEIQAVVRDGTELWYNEFIWNNLGTHKNGTIANQGFERALLQLHETLYYLGQGIFESSEDSLPAQNLIVNFFKEIIPETQAEELELKNRIEHYILKFMK